MLAFSSTEHVQLLLSQKLARVSVRTIVTPDVLLRELEEIAKIGVAYDREESAAGVGCVAAPIFGPEGVVGAISASGYLDRMDLTRVASGVHTSALALSRELGGKQVALGAKPSVASLPSNRATQSGMTTPQSGASRRSMVKRKTVQDRH
jgi:hypothetical protein